jgi:hypothetical protein
MYEYIVCVVHLHKSLKVTATLRQKYIIAVYFYQQRNVTAEYAACYEDEAL